MARRITPRRCSVAGLVDVALRQLELDFGLEAELCSWCSSVLRSSLITHALDAFVDELEQLDQHLVALAR